MNTKARSWIMLGLAVAAAAIGEYTKTAHLAWAAGALALIAKLEDLMRGPPSVPPAAVFALLFALPLSSCAHVTPVWDGIAHCAEQATHVASLGILDDVESALACDAGSGVAELPACALLALEDLGKRFTESAVACAVQEIAHRSSVKAQQNGDKFEELKAERARAWLAKQKVVFQ